MDRPSTSVSSADTSLLDLENVTFEEWRTLLYNKIVQQKNVFLVDFKRKVIGEITACMKNVKPDSVANSIQKHLTKKINENQYEIEYQHFVDGIVGSTFEYFCQLIIKNSMENIKRTQNALSSFSFTNTNVGTIKSCNESIKLPEFPSLHQIQSLPEPSNNTTNSDLMIQPHLFSNNSENDLAPLVEILKKEDDTNTVVNLIETTSTLYSQVQQKADPLMDALNASNGIDIDNYVQNANSIINIDEEDDFKTTQAIISLAMNITNQQEINFRYTDGFEDENVTHLNDLNVSSGIEAIRCHEQQNGDQTSNFTPQHSDPTADVHLGQQNGYENTYLPTIEDEFQITSSLRMLESLVNNEPPCKLEEQRASATEVELPSVEPKPKRAVVKKTRRSSSKQMYVCNDTDEEWTPNEGKHKKIVSKEMNKIRRNNGGIKKSRGRKWLGNTSRGDSSSCSSSPKTFIPASTKINITRSVRRSLELLSNLKTCSSDDESNVTVMKTRRNASSGSKLCPIVGTCTSDCDVIIRKTKAVKSSSSVTKPAGHKRLLYGTAARGQSIDPADVAVANVANGTSKQVGVTVARNGGTTLKTEDDNGTAVEKKGPSRRVSKKTRNKRSMNKNELKRLRFDYDLDNEETDANNKKLKESSAECEGASDYDKAGSASKIVKQEGGDSSSVSSTYSDWVKRKWAEYRLKTAYVVIDRNARYD